MIPADNAFAILIASAIGIAFMHTVIGIDHSLPFVALGRANGWPLRKLWAVTSLCGLGHVLSSVVLGALGVGLGMAVVRLEWIERWRGELAAWLLIIFGLIYAAWAFARRRRGQRHSHTHSGSLVHSEFHESVHSQASMDPRALTTWSLFIIFVLGPCEPLIPLLMAPSAELGVLAPGVIAAAFGVTTIGTMLGMVTLGHLGLRSPAFGHLEVHAHSLAGLAIAASGAAIKLLGV